MLTPVVKEILGTFDHVTATEMEGQLTTRLTATRANQTTGLTNGRALGRATNWAPEVEFSPFRALSRSIAKSA